jgi:two-component system KDP operon response regulator KdpE
MRGYEVLLRARGYRTAGAINGVAAVREVLVQEPDLVILDLGLPAGSGFDFLEWLQSIQAALPVIVVSGLDAGDMALALGAAAYLQKPCDADELLALIEKALG